MHPLELAADENLAVHATWATAQLTGSRVDYARDLVLADSGLPCDTFNFVCRARLGPVAATARVRTAIEFFAEVKRPFSWWLGPGYTPDELPALLVEHGLIEAESELAMAIELARLDADAGLVPGLEIRRVRTASELAAFATLSAANWDPPDQQVIRYYAFAESILLGPGAMQWLYLGWLDGRPVATAEATIGGGVVGLYNISTAPEYRRRGIGLAMTRAPLLDARGAGVTTGILQAAEAGVGVYERLGFTTFGRVTEYKPEV